MGRVRQERYWTEDAVEYADTKALGKLFKNDLARARKELKRIAAKHGERFVGPLRLHVWFEADTGFLPVQFPVAAPEGEGER